MAGVLRPPCASSHTTATSRWRRCSPATVPIAVGQSPDSTSGRAALATAPATAECSRVIRAGTGPSGRVGRIVSATPTGTGKAGMCSSRGQGATMRSQPPAVPRSAMNTSVSRRGVFSPSAIVATTLPSMRYPGGRGVMSVNAHLAGPSGAPEGPAVLPRLRDRLLDEVLGLLEADPAVAGVALVGSLGRGEEDNWSDIDLFILASDQFIGQFMNEPAASPWARADLFSDGRHNSPAGATSLGTTHLRSGLPLWVDLHVHPADRTPWPADGRVLFERRPVKTGTLPFGEYNASGPRQPATAKTADEVRRIHLGYVPTAGKYVGRRSPRACEMIRFLGQRRDFNDHDPAVQLVALRGIAKDLSSPSPGQLGSSVTSYLDLVEVTVQLAGE